MRFRKGQSPVSKQTRAKIRYIGSSLTFAVLLLGLGSFVWRVDLPVLSVIKDEDIQPGVPHTSKRILLATYTRLLWYDYEADLISELSTGLGIYYGTFPGVVTRSGVLRTIWVVTRPVNWRSGIEYLTEIDAQQGIVIRRVALETKFTHDAIRKSGQVYICDTDGGRIVELSYPEMKQTRVLDVFEQRNHINTLAAPNETTLWVIEHNFGKSDAVLIDTTSGRIVQKLKGIGTKSHGFVEWGQQFLSLDSQLARLSITNPSTGSQRVIWTAPEPGSFLKGLVVIDDVAIFGLSKQVPARKRSSINGEVVAVDIHTGCLLWRRNIPTQGLLNTIAAPQLGEESTYKALQTVKTMKGSHLIQAPSGRIGGWWSSGLPFLDLSLLRENPESAVYHLPLGSIDISGILETVQSFNSSMWDEEYQSVHNAVISARKENLKSFKPGVDGVTFIFSDQGGSKAYRLPWFGVYKDVLLPIIEQILGQGYLDRVMRLQLARMPPGSMIKIHRDYGGYAKHGHRIHVPLSSPPGVSFEICGSDSTICNPIPVCVGYAFEVNNLARHRILHQGQADRIHLILDASESAVKHHQLSPGDRCTYLHGDVIC